METTETGTAEVLRQKRGLRALEAEEEGMRAADLPDGIYGFTWSPSFESTPLFARRSFRTFEFHKLANGTIEVIGYLTEPDASRAGGLESGSVDIYPDPWQEAQRLVAMPLSRIVPSKRVPARENGCPWTIELRSGEELS